MSCTNFLANSMRFLSATLLVASFAAEGISQPMGFEVDQTDWSGGPGSVGPTLDWEAWFATSSDVSWRSIPGQVSLSSQARTTPLQTVIAGSAGMPRGVACADLDGDGEDEILTIDPVYDVFAKLGSVDLWDRQPDGTWAQRAVDSNFWGGEHVDAADVDGDGDLDVIACAYYGVSQSGNRNGRYAWFENLTGDASAWMPHLVGEGFWGAEYVDSGDFDGDGDLDLVGASYLTDGIGTQDADVAWFENLDGSGANWSQHDLATNYSGATEAHAEDLDGDGDLDIVTARLPDLGPSSFTWWENLQGDGTAWDPRGVPGTFWGAGHLDAGDIDGDGDVDLIGGGFNSSQIGFWENLDGTATAWQTWAVTSIPTRRGIELADVDGDEDLDALVWSNNGIQNGGVWWIENLDGAGKAWQLRTIKFNTQRQPWMAAGDANGDGKLDAIVTTEDPYQLEIEQLSWWDLTRFDTSGRLTSTILDGGAPRWGTFAWDAIVPPGSDLVVEVRASDDPGNLGPFVVVPKSGTDLGAAVDRRARFLQYRLTFGSSDPAASPIVREISVESGRPRRLGRSTQGETLFGR